MTEQDSHEQVTASVAQITIPVTIQAVSTSGVHEQIAIPIGVHTTVPSGTTNDAALQQLQQQVQQQVQAQQLQQQIQVTQQLQQQVDQVQQIQEQVEQIHQKAQIGQDQQAPVVSAAPAASSSSTVTVQVVLTEENGNDTHEIPLNNSIGVHATDPSRTTNDAALQQLQQQQIQVTHQLQQQVDQVQQIQERVEQIHQEEQIEQEHQQQDQQALPMVSAAPAASSSSTVTVQVVLTEENGNDTHEIPLNNSTGVHATVPSRTTNDAALQQLQQQVQHQVQQQVQAQQLQQQHIQVTHQLQQQVDQVQQIQERVKQIHQEAQIEQDQQKQKGQDQQALPVVSAASSSSTDTVQVVLTEENGKGTHESSLNNSTASLNDSMLSDSSIPRKSKWAKYVKRYNKKWESEPGLMEWIRRVPGEDTKVACRYCQNTIRAHHTELRRHSNSAKHKSQAAYVVLPFFMSGRTLARMVMRAVRVTEWGGPEVLQVLQDVVIPEPQENQVLIKVGAAGVNPVETYIRSGQYANLPSLPWTPGNDCAGTVEIVGPDVTRFKPGDRVYTYGTDTGTYAEYTLSMEENVYGLPDQLDFRHGAGLGIPYYTAYRALIQRAHAKSGYKVLVHGASGAVGVATVQFAKAYGMTVLGTASTTEGMDIAKKSGAQFVFNHREQGYTDQILTATSGEGVDVVIEMLANVNLQKDLELLAPGGIVAVVGNRGTVEINPRLLMPKESSIVGVMLPKGEEGQKARKVTSAAIRAGIESGWLKPHIGKEFPLEGASLAHDEIINGAGAKGRIVLIP